jgi:hypothetical protein
VHVVGSASQASMRRAGADLPNRIPQRVDLCRQQIRPAVERVRSGEDCATRNPIATISRHDGSLLKRRRALPPAFAGAEGAFRAARAAGFVDRVRSPCPHFRECDREKRETIRRLQTARLSSLRAPCVCAAICDSGAPLRRARGPAVPTVFRNCGEASFPGIPLRVAFFSSRL